MIAYIIRRALYARPILIGVNIITFLLFFVVNSPDDMARMFLGQKHVTEEQIEDTKARHCRAFFCCWWKRARERGQIESRWVPDESVAQDSDPVVRNG